MSLLEMKHIRKSFDDLEVIKDISLSVEKGEILSDHRTVRLRKIHASALCHHAGDHRQR